MRYFHDYEAESPKRTEYETSLADGGRLAGFFLLVFLVPLSLAGVILGALGDTELMILSAGLLAILAILGFIFWKVGSYSGRELRADTKGVYFVDAEGMIKWPDLQLELTPELLLMQSNDPTADNGAPATSIAVQHYLANEFLEVVNEYRPDLVRNLVEEHGGRRYFEEVEEFKKATVGMVTNAAELDQLQFDPPSILKPFSVKRLPRFGRKKPDR